MSTGKEFVKEAYRAIFQNDFQKAIEFFKKAIHRDSNNPTYYYKLSVTLARNNDLPEAMEAIEQALRLRPQHSFYQQHYRMLQGRFLAKEALDQVEKGKEPAEVLPLLTESIRLDPINTQSRLLYAWLLGEEGRVKEAIHALKELLALDPWHFEAKELLKELSNQK